MSDLYFPHADQQTMLNKFRDWELAEQLPRLQVPDWADIIMVPPFGGVALRFLAVKKNAPRLSEWVSVYLDLTDALGSMGRPYWEIYPNSKGDNERFGLHEINLLWKAIKKSLDAML